MLSFVVPAGHWSLGLKITVVSAMFVGAGSVAVSARPILPTTISTAGSAAMMRSCWRITWVAVVKEMRGSVIGMKSAVSSSRGGMNSEPIVVAMNRAEANKITATATIANRNRNAQRNTG